MMTSHKFYLHEALKVTLFCLIITGLFKLCGASNNMLLIVMNMSVISFAATFSPDKKPLSHATKGSALIIISMIAGGIVGNYFPLTAQILTLLFAGLAFYLPKTKLNLAIMINSTVMFLIFSALPFNVETGLHYLAGGVLVWLAFIGTQWLIQNKNAGTPNEAQNQRSIDERRFSCYVILLSLLIGLSVAHYLEQHHYLSHVYWIALTIFFVTQGASQKTIETAFKRIGVNLAGAILTVALFGYVIPPLFWVNFVVLVVFLFLIFFLSFSYIGRVLFIEMFVLGFTRLLSDYQNVLALDRITMTLIGGVIAILATLFVYKVIPSKRLHHN